MSLHMYFCARQFCVLLEICSCYLFHWTALSNIFFFLQPYLSFFVGGTWWFPPFSNLRKLLKELEIDLVKQYIDGVAYYENETDKPAREINFHTRQPSSMFRIKGKD